jgi:hypothetical protein
MTFELDALGTRKGDLDAVVRGALRAMSDCGENSG